METIKKNLRKAGEVAAGIGRFPVFRSISAYLVIASLCFIILVWRFPNLLLYPNFYAEDGSIFFQNINDKGVWGAAWTAFNGYFIVGLYALMAVAGALNSISGTLLSLPAFYSGISTAFLAAVISLPYLLFKSTLGKLPMLLVVLCSVLMPLPQSASVVIGNIGNQKFTFFYLAFLLIIYRMLNWRRLSWKRTVVVDALILLCVYTNSAVYLLLPLPILVYLRELFVSDKAKAWRSKLRTTIMQNGLISLVVLYALSLPQLIYVALNGIPDLPGYLDTPYDSSKSVEIFANRTLLFGFTHYINGYLGDLRVLALLGILIICAGVFLRGKRLFIFVASAYAAVAASLLFVLSRPGVSDFFFRYQAAGSGPDQFFFAQTLIMYFGVIPLLFAVSGKVRQRGVRPVMACGAALIVAVFGILSILQYGYPVKHSGIYENYNQTLADQALSQCKDQPAGQKRLHAYVPGGQNNNFVIRVSGDQLCSPLTPSMQPSADYLALRPLNNNHIPVTGQSQVQQQVVASQDGLTGIKIFLSNFGKTARDGRYKLLVYDRSCTRLLRSAELPDRTLDNSFYRAYFDEIRDSKGQQYCFTLSPPQQPFDRLAVQLSAPDSYQPQLKVEGTPRSEDVVFDLLYNQFK